MSKAILTAMEEYGKAIRGDWSNFDGRSMRDVIDDWVEELVAPTGKTVEQWRDWLNLCPDGNGHWAGFGFFGHCNKEECPISYERDGDPE